MPSPTGRWNDARLDDLHGRVAKIEPLVTEVAVLKTEFGNLSRELRANTKATQGVTDQLEKSQLEPLDRKRRFWSAIVIGIASAAAGGVFVFLGTIVAGH